MTIAGLDDATAALSGAVLGPRELEAALGFDPLTVLTPDERARIDRLPFSAADWEKARADGEFLVLRVPRDPGGSLTMLRLAERLGGGFDPKVHTGVGYALRDEWTIDLQAFATEDTAPAGWYLVRRAPIAATCNKPYRDQDAVLDALGSARPGVPRRRSAVEVAFDTLCWNKAHGERLLGDTWDWTRSASSDQGLAALGEHGAAGLGVIAYSRAVRFGTLGVCAQR